MGGRHSLGERVQTSGTYKVSLHGDARSGFEVRCVEGEHFPPTPGGASAHYKLLYLAAGSKEESKLGTDRN
ncbi:hypothetical protein QCE47_27025 [Caballeronia sp. LZ025]|nr:hypothetical protein [Caballeronia grimmiae]MDR5735972.1 hypothetical protein [Caballeronia sp. LZ025]